MSAEVDEVDIPGAEGWMGILPNHAPLMTTLAPGMVRIKNGNEENRIFVRGGFAEISPAGLTVLAEEAMPASELDAEAIAKRAMQIAAEICVYTNDSVVVETLDTE